MTVSRCHREEERSSGSHWSAMNTKDPGRPGMASTKVGCEKKVNAFSRSEPPVQGLPRLCHSPRGSLQEQTHFPICQGFNLANDCSGKACV